MSDNTINLHHNKIVDLKTKLIDTYKNNKNGETAKIDNILKEMRIIHGCAINDDQLYRNYIASKDKKTVRDDEWIKLSTNASLLHIMHCNIRKCDKIAYAYKKGIIHSFASSDSDMQTTIHPQSIQHHK